MGRDKSDEQLAASFGAKLYETRKDRGFNGPQALADKCGVSKSHIERMEAGRALPSIETAIALANVLDTGLDYLFATRHMDPKPSLAGVRLYKIAKLLREVSDFIYEECGVAIPESLEKVQKAQTNQLDVVYGTIERLKKAEFDEIVEASKLPSEVIETILEELLKTRNITFFRKEINQPDGQKVEHKFYSIAKQNGDSA